MRFFTVWLSLATLFVAYRTCLSQTCASPSYTRNENVRRIFEGYAINDLTFGYTLTEVFTYGVDNTPFVDVKDVRFSTYNDGSFYLADEGNSKLIFLNSDLTARNAIDFPSPTTLTTHGSKVFVGRQDDGSDFFTLDRDLNSYQSVSVDTNYVYRTTNLRYNPYAGLIYQTDSSTNYLNAFSIQLNRVSSVNIFSLTGEKPYASAAYYHQTLGVLTFVPTTGNKLFVLKSDGSIHKQFDNACSSQDPKSVNILETGEVLLSCSGDWHIRLYLITLNDIVNTYQYVVANNYFTSIAVDSHGQLFVANRDRLSIYKADP